MREGGGSGQAQQGIQVTKIRAEVGSPLERRSGMGAALLVLCAQSCQRSRGQIVERLAASRSEEEG